MDAHVYFRATSAYLAGGDPWAASFFDVPFAAPPPAVLLNLPLVPLGEDLAVAFWVAANAAGAIYIVRKLNLPAYWLLCFPIVEGFCAGSPDLTLAGLALWRGAWLAAFIKPYAIPAIIAAGRWRSVAVCAVLLLLTVPLVPWGRFVADRSAIGAAFDSLTSVPSAWGEPVLLAATSAALLTLRRDALDLATPGLVAQQAHYLVFSLKTISPSFVLTVCSTLPIRHLMAFGIIAYALIDRITDRRSSA